MEKTLDEIILDKKEIGRFIYSKRKENNLTQQELADRLYVSDRAVSKWERGLSIPDIETLRRLSEIFKVSTDEILSAKEINKQIHSKSIFEILTIILVTIFYCMYNASAILINFNIEYTFIMFALAFAALIIFIKRELDVNIKQKVLRVSSYVYTVTLLTYILYTGISNRANNIIATSFEINLIPFAEIFKIISLVFKGIQPAYFLFNYIVINLFLFMPYALFIPYLNKNIKERKLILIVFIIITLKELIQLITRLGVFDINDIILNLIGVFLAYKFLNKIKVI